MAEPLDALLVAFSTGMDLVDSGYWRWRRYLRAAHGVSSESSSRFLRTDDDSHDDSTVRDDDGRRTSFSFFLFFFFLFLYKYSVQTEYVLNDAHMHWVCDVL